MGDLLAGHISAADITLTLLESLSITLRSGNVHDHRAGTSGHSIHKHAQVRLRVHHNVIRQFLIRVGFRFVMTAVTSRLFRLLMAHADRFHCQMSLNDPIGAIFPAGRRNSNLKRLCCQIALVE